MFPPLPVLVGGTLGYLALGATATFLRPSGPGTAAGVLLPLATIAGAGLFTLPSVLVGREWLGMERPASEVVRGHLDTLARGGFLALALSPVVAFFATSGQNYAFDTLSSLAQLGLAGATLLAAAMGLGGQGERRGAGLLGLGWLLLTTWVSVAAHMKLGGA